MVPDVAQLFRPAPPIALILLVMLAAAPAAAQGRGKGLGKTKGGSGPATSGSAAPASTSRAAAGAGIRQFAAWLDDASLLAPGSAWTSMSFGHYRSIGGSQTDFPVIDAGIGLSNRVQFGITVPYYRVHFLDGTNVGGLGDVFLSGKVLLLEAGATGRVGVAVSPVLEISEDPAPGRGSLTWAAPVSVEFRGSKYRLFGSTGYFSRGALFGSGAVEVPLADNVVVVGALTLMRSIREDVAADSLGLSAGRTDVTATAAYFLTSAIALFGGTGRTVGNADGTGTAFMLTGGVSLSFSPRAPSSIK